MTTQQGWPDRLWVVRHGESAGNVARDAAYASGLSVIDIAERDVDVPLSALGEHQSGALGEWFSGLAEGERPTVVLTSPYLRARQTATSIREAGGVAHDALTVIDERLREKEFGILDRLTKLGIEQKFPDQAALRARIGKFYFRPPGGESWCDVILRLRSVLDTVSLHYSSPGSRVLVVGHQVIVLCLRYLIEELTEDEILAIDRRARWPIAASRRTRSTGMPRRADCSDWTRTTSSRRSSRRAHRSRRGPTRRRARMSRRAPRAIAVTRALLRRLPLPKPDETGSKDERGQVLVVGGRRRSRVRCGSRARRRFAPARASCSWQR